MEYLDNKLRKTWKQHPNTLVAWVLISSYAYYIMDSPILSDQVFDKLCKHLYDEWDKYKHPHKHLIERDSLRAGTLFYLRHEDYPLIVKCSVVDLIEEVYGDHRGQPWMDDIKGL